jgi:hypothetical protein
MWSAAYEAAGHAVSEKVSMHWHIRSCSKNCKMPPLCLHCYCRYKNDHNYDVRRRNTRPQGKAKYDRAVQAAESNVLKDVRINKAPLHFCVAVEAGRSGAYHEFEAIMERVNPSVNWPSKHV